MKINDNPAFYVPDYYLIERDKLYLLIDPEMPNWIVTNKRGVQIINNVKIGKGIKELIYDYANEFNIDLVKAWLEIDSFLKDLIRCEFLSSEPIKLLDYTGRVNYIHLDKLNELWIHTNNSCNLTCAHCLVDSHPDGDKGLPADAIKKVVDEGVTLGTSRFYFTGGEPFMRKDIFEFIEFICNNKEKELIILTNGTLLKEDNIERLKGFGKKLLKFQISLDGSRPEINDPIRGNNSFARTIEGIKNLISIGFSPTITTAITNHNVDDLPDITRLIAQIGAKTHHLIWLHNRGRIINNGSNLFVSINKLIEVIKRVKEVANRSGVIVDNLESYRFRLNSSRGIRYDLGNACYDSLCVYSNGDIFPSASFVGYEGIRCGNIFGNSIEETWKNSSISIGFRTATLQNKTDCSRCYIRFICGGGDIEHSFFYSRNWRYACENIGSIPNPESSRQDLKSAISDRHQGLQQIYFPKDTGVHAPDPYCSMHKEIIIDTIFALVKERLRLFKRKTGFTAPIVLRAMGEGAIVCPSTIGRDSTGKTQSLSFNPRPVYTLHSNCVLSFDVYKPRQAVAEFYGKAAETPQKDLCCPTINSHEDISHIPQEVLDRFYGCGSPVSLAGIVKDETIVDLGSGAGIDCFIAAKKVGPKGKIYGVDMTDKMLKIANKNNRLVSNNLGYDIVEFKKGFLEDIPISDKTADLIISNCVINLSPDKKMVFWEMWRVLKDYGRIVISDIVSQEEIPPHLKANRQLWGACISGALTEEAFLAFLEQAGFNGLQILQKTLWKEIDGYSFFSITVRGYKYEKKEGCVYIGQKAIYLGPHKAVIDEECHLFPRNEAVEICTDTATKLIKPPYSGQFIIVNPYGGNKYNNCSTAGKGPCC